MCKNLKHCASKKKKSLFILFFDHVEHLDCTYHGYRSSSVVHIREKKC